MKYLSPTAVSLWKKNKQEFFLKYIAIDRPPRMPQTKAMSVGSSFDAFVKCYLYARLFGKDKAAADGFTFDQLFEKQVEPLNRDFAMAAGANCFLAYKQSGAMGRLFEALNTAKEPPRFEFTAMSQGIDDNGNVYNTTRLTDACRQKVVDGFDANPVIILGKPDVAFVTKSDINVTLDWKVNGYCAATGRLPTQGYLYVLDGFTPVGKNHGASHRDAIPHVESCGLEYSLHPNIELFEEEWARQLCTYSWLCGAAVGSEIVVAIDQLCCRPSHPSPNISVALHRCTVTEGFQFQTWEMFQSIWNVVHSDHIFRDVSLEESQKRCDMLSRQALAYQGEDENTQWLKSLRTHQ